METMVNIIMIILMLVIFFNLPRILCIIDENPEECNDYIDQLEQQKVQETIKKNEIKECKNLCKTIFTPMNYECYDECLTRKNITG